MTVPSEHDEQVSVVKYCDLKKIPCFAVPNGSNKSIAAAKKFKAEGLRAGVPDLCVLLDGLILFIEMKRRKNSVLSKNQKEWIAIINTYKYAKSFVAYGANEAIQIIKDNS